MNDKLTIDEAENLIRGGTNCDWCRVWGFENKVSIALDSQLTIEELKKIVEILEKVKLD